MILAACLQISSEYIQSAYYNYHQVFEIRPSHSRDSSRGGSKRDIGSFPEKMRLHLIHCVHTSPYNSTVSRVLFSELTRKETSKFDMNNIFMELHLHFHLDLLFSEQAPFVKLINTFISNSLETSHWNSLVYGKNRPWTSFGMIDFPSKTSQHQSQTGEFSLKELRE